MTRSGELRLAISSGLSLEIHGAVRVKETPFGRKSEIDTLNTQQSELEERLVGIDKNLADIKNRLAEIAKI